MVARTRLLITLMLIGSLFGIGLAGAQTGTVSCGAAEMPALCQGDMADDSPALREEAHQRVIWRSRNVPPGANPEAWLRIKVLAINDFHGQLSAGRRVGTRPVGSAGVLASYLRTVSAGMEDRTFIVQGGDHVGASPPVSALLQDEPSITFLNMLGNADCSADCREDPRCNLVATVGNHEFDEGRDELLRLLYGGTHPNGPFLEDPYPGSTFPAVAANVVDKTTGMPILPPYVIKKVRGMPVAFIGAVLKETPTIVTASGTAGLAFLDEAEAINRYIPELHAQHVKTVIALIHQGGGQTSYQGPTRTSGRVTGAITAIISKLDDEVDVVISGHTHSFTNAILTNAGGREILVTQAFSAGTAYADIDLFIDPATKDVVEKSASIVTTWADTGPGLTPDPAVTAYVSRAEAMVAPLVNRVIGAASRAITRTQNRAGESALGNLIADAQRSVMATDFAFMNPGGIRADLDAGDVTWGELFTVQPFANYLVTMTLTGRQVYNLLEQQWLGQTSPRMLQISGLTYLWDAARPVGSRIVEARKDGAPIDLAATYTVTVNSFLAGGGDNFIALTGGLNQVYGPIDLDALVEYLSGLPQPFSASVEERITRWN